MRGTKGEEREEKIKRGKERSIVREEKKRKRKGGEKKKW